MGRAASRGQIIAIAEKHGAYPDPNPAPYRHHRLTSLISLDALTLHFNILERLVDRDTSRKLKCV